MSKTVNRIVFQRIIMTAIRISQPTLFGQDQSPMQGSYGTVTVYGKVWNQVALRPVIQMGEFAVA